MKKTKMSRRGSQGLREMNRSLRVEMERHEMERLEQQRIDFEHRAHQARNNLYGLGSVATRRGWIDNSSR